MLQRRCALVFVALLGRGLGFRGDVHSAWTRGALPRRPQSRLATPDDVLAEAKVDGPTPPPGLNDAAPPSSQERMRAKLKAEAEYPLFAPLLGASAVIGGKGLTDALLTVAKVSAGMKGASLSETFLGVPVLAIDAVCVVVGAALASYTWSTMRSEAPKS